MKEYDRISNATAVIRSKIGGFAPEILLILGSGLGFLSEKVENPICVDYADIPNFPVCTAPAHRGRFVFGELEGRRVMIADGRFHCYEGYSMLDAAAPVRVAKMLGAETLLITNAAGGVNLNYSRGDIMCIEDHIKLVPNSPLTGENDERFGERFPNMVGAYTPRLIDVAYAAASTVGVDLHRGVYMYFAGPQYETPAEIRAARYLGADAVGMSTVPEVVAASQAKMEVLGFSLVSNLAAGMTGENLSEEEVLEAAENAKEDFSALVLTCLVMI